MKVATFLHYRFDKARADKAVRFIETCCILSSGVGAGQPLKLRPWQKDLIKNIFGWIDPKTGLRRYRKVFILIARRNGKSSLCAAIALYMLFADGEAGAQVILAANSISQGSIVYDSALAMVRNSPALKDVGHCTPANKKIFVESTNSFLKVISAEAPTALGLNISTLIYDELAASTDRSLYDALTTAQGSRTNPLQVFITTSSANIQAVGYSLYLYAKQVKADPKLDPTFLPVIYELDEGDDWTLEKNWYKANPALNVFKMLDDMRNKLREALTSTTEQAKFKMYDLNQWIGSADSALDTEKWKVCGNPHFEIDDLKDLPCYVGLDLSSNQDFTALVALWVGPDNKHYIKPYLFLPGDDLRDRELKDHVGYTKWHEDKNILCTPGSTVDYSFIKRTLKTLAESNNIKAVAYDPWHAHQLITELQLDGFNCVKIRQGHESLAAPTKEFETLMMSKHIIHDANPAMQWMIGNVVYRPDANNNFVVDKKRSRQRIDGVAAAIMALGCAVRLQTAEPIKKPVPFRITVLG